MINQRALHIACSDGSHDLVELESSNYLGPVDYAWSIRNEDDPTVLGIGPLAATGVPGASGLVMAGRSLLWDGFYSSMLPGAGLTLAGLGFTLLALRGRAAQPSVLLVSRSDVGTLDIRLEALDPEELWRGTHDGEGIYALLHHLAQRHGDRAPNLQVMATGPAAARTRFGSICTARFEEGRPAASHGWYRRGGLGSRLFQVHNLCGIVIGCRPRVHELVGRSVQDASALGGFQPELSSAELEALVRYEFNPKLLAWGDIGASLSALRTRLLWFNGASVYLSSEERDDLYHRALRDHYLAGLLEPMTHQENHRTCGESCPLICKCVHEGRLREMEPYVALGPQLGVLDPAAADQVVAHCDTLGFDSLAIGASVAWLMERLDRRLVEPGFLGVTGQPHWSASGFEPVSDSQDNARLARSLVDGVLFSSWGQVLHGGLREAARAAGDPSAPLAVYNAAGDSGEIPIFPCWAPGFFTPMPIPGERLGYYGIDFVPPRVLGQKSAQRMQAELMLQNFGCCRLHRGWAEELLPDLVNRSLKTNTDWGSHHRDLAKWIFRRRKARFWETRRTIDIIATYLQDYQHNAAPDPELDRWVRRFREDRASAARAYWSEVNAGLEELLGA
jgi:glyceraldehyde-3-phosphate dehydrogenase (ferredoxin)